MESVTADILLLEKAAASGDPDARFELSIGLLEGRPAPADVRRAADLLELASSSGHARASERCALFAAMGVTRPQSWDSAFDYLELAAEQGSGNACSQLRLLAGEPSPSGAAPDQEPHDWAAVRANIRIDELLRIGERTRLSEAPRIHAFAAFATEPECRWMVSIARQRLERATVFDKSTGGQTHNDARDNSSVGLQLDLMDVVTEVLRNRISVATRLPVPLFEPSQLLHYAVGQRFRPHHDYLDPDNAAYKDDLAQFGQRIGTFLIYLNGDFEGGQTNFPALGLNLRGRPGDALFFTNVDREGRPDPKTIHAGLPPTSGEKWVFSQWIRDRLPSG